MKLLIYRSDQRFLWLQTRKRAATNNEQWNAGNARLLIRVAKKLPVSLRISSGFERLAKFCGIEVDLSGNVRQYVEIADVKALLEERAHHCGVISVGAPTLFCKFEAFEREPRVGLRRDARQADLDAHAGGEWINRIAPCTLEITFFGSQGGCGIRAQLKGHPGDLDIPAADGFMEREFGKKAEGADVIRVDADGKSHHLRD